MAAITFVSSLPVLRPLSAAIVTVAATVPQRPVSSLSARPLAYNQPATFPAEPADVSHTTVDPFEDLSPSPVTSPSSSSSPRNVVVVVPGYGATAQDYVSMLAALRAARPGLDARVAPVRLVDWAPTLYGSRSVSAVLRAVDAAVRAAAPARVTLVGHSAGGWVSRIYLGDAAPYRGVRYAGRAYVDQLLCLSTPHASAEQATAANMRFVNAHYPGAFYAGHGVDYVNFAGDAVTVPPTFPWWKVWSPVWVARLAYHLTHPHKQSDSPQSDQASECLSRVGDGIVPLSVAFLAGATNIRLEGVWHSPESNGPWFGDEQVVRYWSKFIK